MIQLRVSRRLNSNKDTKRPSHAKGMMKLYNFNGYINKFKPTLFYGCYSYLDLMTIKRHSGLMALYWGGSDILKMKNINAKFPDRLIHVVQTDKNAIEIKKYFGKEATVRPLIWADKNKFSLVPLGNCIYSYIGWNRNDFYGIQMIKKISNEFPNTKFIFTRCKSKPIKNCESYGLVNENSLVKIYSRCFCGIRPIGHDGFSQTIGEMALMGRRSGWIYSTKCSDRCIDLNDYIEFISNEMNRKNPDLESRKYIIENTNNLDFIREMEE